MSRAIILDTGPLGLLTNPRKTPETRAITRWALDMMTAGHRLVVPAIADYEVRRELERVGRRQGLAQLDAFNTARADRYLRACYALWIVDIPYAQGNSHFRARGNPGGPPELDPGIRRDDVSSGHP